MFSGFSGYTGSSRAEEKGLVGYWKFDESKGEIAKDFSGNGNDGKIYGAKWVKGKIGQALQFDGINDYVDCGTGASLNITDAITIEAWVNLKEDKWCYILGKGYSINYGITLGYHPVPKCWRVTNHVDGYNSLYFGSRKLLNHWVHIVVTMDNSLPSANWKMYENGILKKTANHNNFILRTRQSLYIGRDATDARYFNGVIDEVRIYNRALTAAEVVERIRLKNLTPPEWQAITKPVETPHIKWAKPYSMKGPKVLFLFTEDYQREITELSQRMDIEVDFLPLRGMSGIIGGNNKNRFKFIEEKLKNSKYDVILSSKLLYGEFPEEIQKIIVDKVAAGAGFICIGPSPKSDILSEILPFSSPAGGSSGRWHKAKEHFITRGGIPFPFMPASSSSRYRKFKGETLVSSGKERDPLLSVNEYKKGRVVAFSYHNKGWLTAEVDHYEVEFNYWEYYYSMLIKSILWASQKEPDLKILSLKPEGEEIRRDKTNRIRIELQSNEDTRGNIQILLRNKRYEVVKEYSKKLNIKKDISGAIEFVIPRYLEAGIHLADIFIRDSQDRILNWGTAYFKTAGNIEVTEVKTDKEHYRKPEDKKNIKINLKINNKEEDNKKISLGIEFFDSFGRLLIAKTQKEILSHGTNQANLTIHPKNLISPIHKLRVTLRDNTGVLFSHTSPVYTPKEPDEGFSDYFVSFFINYQPLYLHPHFYQLSKEIGLGGEVSFLTDNSYLRMLSENNLWHQFDSVQVIFFHNPIKLPEGGYIRQSSQGRHGKSAANMCFSNPSTSNRMKAGARTRTKNTLRHNILSYTMGHESGLSGGRGETKGVCFCKHCQQRFREWLRKEYKTLETLNNQWSAGYDSWEKVVPIPWEKANKANPSQWIDFRTFMEDEYWIGGIKEIADEIIKVNPGAYVGISFSEGRRDTEFPFSGWNYAKLYKYDRCGNVYNRGKLKLELLRSLKNHKTSSFTGYSYPDARIKHITWKWALHGACGAGYFLGFQSDPGFGYQWIIHPNICHCGRSITVKEAVEDLVKGTGKLLINTPRYKEDEIGVLYFRPSLYRSWIEDSVVDGPSYSSYFSTVKTFPALIESLQLQYNFIIEEQALEGELNKYKVVFLPYMVSASPEILAKIDEFVKQGGVVIANMRLASCDRHGKPADYSSFLKRVFGFKRPEQAEYSFDPGYVSGAKEYQGIALPEKIRVTGKEKITPVSSVVIAGHKDNTPAITVNKYGKGYAVYLNFIPETDTGTRKLIEKALTLGGIKREIRLTAKAVEVSGYETFRWKKGDIEYVGILRGVKGGDEKIHISLPYKAHLYDVREKEYSGFTDETFSDFKAPDYKVFALLPYEVKGVNLSLKPDYKQGEEVRYKVKIEGKGQIGDHTLRIEVYDPDGNLSEAYTKNLIAQEGKYEDIIPLALNEKTGQWKIKAMDIVSGKYREKSFSVKNN